MRRFYDGQHRFYCDVDLHIKRMYLCILDRDGSKLQHRNVQANPSAFLLPNIPATAPEAQNLLGWLGLKLLAGE